ncbi:MAG: leucyl/phenylalanyl-tRNA--protein transferase [Geminicoccaceae bacterium]
MLTLTSDLLLTAYASGVFPMADDRDDPTVQWIDPHHRGIIPLDSFHLPRSLKKVIRKKVFEVTANKAFAEVISACAECRDDRPRTWLNDDLIDLYCEVHELGYAHSVECWVGDRLVGGVYGVSLGSAFFGESMFSRERDASKVALAGLVERLIQGGYWLLDTQFVTDHLRQFGALEISRAAYHRRLRDAIDAPAVFHSDGGAMLSSTPWASGGAAVGSSQSTTQMS